MDSHKNRLNASVNVFGFELYQDLRNDGGNSIVCPFGLQVLLAMALEGAEVVTADEISKVLHHSKNDKEILQGYKATISSLESPSLRIATRMFIERTVKVKDSFKSLTSEYFSCEIDRVDLSKSPEDSRSYINEWAEEKTNHKIKDLLPPGSLRADTSSVMVNAIHFYAPWKTQFDAKMTMDMPFYVTPNKSRKVKMMVTCKPFPFLEFQELEAKVVKLLYADEKFGMIIVLPNKLDGLPLVENKLKSMDLSKEFSSHHNPTVNLMLPRFKIEKTIDLNRLLSQKIPTAFTDKANFSGITDVTLNISKIIQKTFIEVNEEGTEAIAATGVVMAARSMRIVHDFKCDHPFFFQIVKDGLILFQGAVIEPDS